MVFTRPDREPFVQAVAPVYEKYRPKYGDMIDKIQAIRRKSSWPEKRNVDGGPGTLGGSLTAAIFLAGCIFYVKGREVCVCSSC